MKMSFFRKKDPVAEKKKVVEKIMEDVGNATLEWYKEIEKKIQNKTFFPPDKDFAMMSIEYIQTIGAERCQAVDRILESELTPIDFGELLFVSVLKDLMKDELKGEKQEKAKRLGWMK